MSNNSLEDKNVKMLLIVVVVGLVLYLLVSYFGGNGLCGFRNKSEGFQSGTNANTDLNSAPFNTNNNAYEEENTEEEEQDEEITEEFGNTNQVVEGFENNDVEPSETLGENETQASVQESSGESSQLPQECYPKEVLSSGDLLPNDANSKWAQVNPNGQGGLSEKNFLNAGYHVGVNTVGQSLRNANRQLRSDPPNPQVKVSPWMQTTIESDTNRKPMEIGA
jgi:hypothetical protein